MNGRDVRPRDIRKAWKRIPDGTLFAAQQVAEELGVPVRRVIEVVYPDVAAAAKARSMAIHPSTGRYGRG